MVHLSFKSNYPDIRLLTTTRDILSLHLTLNAIYYPFIEKVFNLTNFQISLNIDDVILTPRVSTFVKFLVSC